MKPSAGPAASVSLFQKTAKVYPRSVDGLFARWRWILVWVTQLIFYGTPWLQWNGRQAVWFDLETPRFYIFALVLQPQELIFLAALLVISALALFFFTALAGRLWCGYACPQSVYTQIFLWMELRTEGDRSARMRLDRQPWGRDKLLRKGGKHAAWIAFSAFTGFTFVGYFLPIRELALQAATLALTPWATFWVVFYGFATYGNAGWLREQICTYMCPYARFQSTLLDGDSLVIAYDAARGDPRGARLKKADPKTLGLGACIDCSLCVQVCPTGIDIRDGLQAECIGCAACIDACDDVMDKMGYPRGLIRYGTANGVAQGWTRRQQLARVLRPRVLIYGGLLAGSVAAFAAALALRPAVGMDVIRDRGVMARVAEDGRIENLYRVQLTNRRDSTVRYQLGVAGLDGLRVDDPQVWTLQPGELQAHTLRLSLPPEAAGGEAGARRITLTLTEPGAAEPALREDSTFLLPR
ncbi:MAG: cytochrome c oxidase accessory protein CcoG [Burkholderiaceae bacterium]|nr:cytochrome c oxidase accessory protein CcoG [Burkholderiaceae bacterium]